MLASAASEQFTAYRFSATNFPAATASYWEVYGLPVPAETDVYMQQNVDVWTDASGKIMGSGYITLSTTNSLVTGFTVTVSGKISTSGSTPVVTMTIKGSGGTYDGTGKATSTKNTISLNFTGKIGADPVNPNDIVGTLSGSIKGDSAFQSKSTSIKQAAARITSSNYDVSTFTIDNEGVLQNSKNTKMTLFSEYNTGTGTIDKSRNYKASVKGIGWDKGMSFQASGESGTNTDTVGTSSIVFFVPWTVNIKGKIYGQTVSGATDKTSAYLVH